MQISMGVWNTFTFTLFLNDDTFNNNTIKKLAAEFEHGKENLT